MAAVLVAVAAGASCRAHPVLTSSQAMPDIPVYELAQPAADAPVTIARAPRRDPLGELGATRRVTLTTSGADVRTLLLWLAREAGVSLVVTPDVDARVSVSFTDVPAADAMRAIIAAAHLSVLASALESPWPPVVFYQLPVNVDTASPEVIASRFGVSQELARWMVEVRSPR